MFDLDEKECQKVLNELAQARQGVVDALNAAHETLKDRDENPDSHNKALHALEEAREREQDAWKMVRRATEPTP